MNCCAYLFKYILYIINIIFLICGILLITLGSIMLSNMGSFKSFEDAVNTETIPILIIILGSIVFIVSFFGCCGAIRENVCCTSMYAICMFILFCLQIALVVWVLVKENEFLDAMSDLVNTAFKENTSAKGYPMDALQVSFKCCGVNGWQDYLATSSGVPNSCCGSLNANSCDASVYETKPGCQDEFVDFWRTNMNIIGYAGIGVACIELIAFTMACCLIQSFRRGGGHNL